MAASMVAENVLLTDLQKQLKVARSEIKNLRQQIYKLKKYNDEDVKSIRAQVDSIIKSQAISGPVEETQSSTSLDQLGNLKDFYKLKTVGCIQSVFKYKNGTPRQPTVCEASCGTLTIDKTLFTNPEHSLEGLHEFSHVWILFIFHQNNNSYFKAKVKPPRLNGSKMGLFATRCPYRPNPIGLSLAKIVNIEGDTIHLSGLDILDGTPVIDIKPFIPQYDVPRSVPQSEKLENNSQSLNADESGERQQSSDTRVGLGSSTITDINSKPSTRADGETETGFDATVDSDSMQIKLVSLESETDCQTIEVGNNHVALWLNETPISELKVSFTPSAESQIKQFGTGSTHVGKYKLEFLNNSKELKGALVDILREDPRSTYRRRQCKDSLYYFSIDKVHVTCWFDGKQVEVLKVQSVNDVSGN